MAGQGTGYIFRALAANFLIAVTKGVGAVITGSGAMLAETLHSLSDCVNQVLLLVGLRQARRPPTEKYPLGQGRDLYFWSFMVAMLLFLGGGAYSIYEGIHKLQHPSPVVEPAGRDRRSSVRALAIEGWAMIGALAAVKARRGGPAAGPVPARDQGLRPGRDLRRGRGGRARPRARADRGRRGVRRPAIRGGTRSARSCIGGVLIGVAVFLAVEVKSLLLGESADPALLEVDREAAPARTRGS